MKKSILFWLVFASAILIALYLSVRISMAALGIGNIAPVGPVSVRAKGTASAGDIANALRMQPGKSAYSVDLDDCLSRITGLPDVGQAAIRKYPNGRMEVKLTMRKIVANWTDGGKFYPLAADGKIMNRAADTADAGMLVFSGVLPDNIADIAEIIKNTPNVFSEIETLSWIEGRRWDLATRTGITVRLPGSGVKAAISKLSALQKQNSILNRKISVIDMRDSDRTLVVIGNR
ncbi:MAG: cell division protein FtsQ [Rickettsiales bacterium]|jgi:cell division protein FtsQ|nr:cell division protein FtsQ [Rickettsiales bacterium]